MAVFVVPLTGHRLPGPVRTSTRRGRSVRQSQRVLDVQQQSCTSLRTRTVSTDNHNASIWTCTWSHDPDCVRSLQDQWSLGSGPGWSLGRGLTYFSVASSSLCTAAGLSTHPCMTGTRPTRGGGRESTQQHICYVMQRCPSYSQRRRCSAQQRASGALTDRRHRCGNTYQSDGVCRKRSRPCDQTRASLDLPQNAAGSAGDEGRSQQQSAAVAPGNNGSQRSRLRPE